MEAQVKLKFVSFPNVWCFSVFNIALHVLVGFVVDQLDDVFYLYQSNFAKMWSLKSLFVTLDHKTSVKSLGYICSNSQKYIVWVKMIDFHFMSKIIRTLSKDHVPWRYFL